MQFHCITSRHRDASHIASHASCMYLRNESGIVCNAGTSTCLPARVRVVDAAQIGCIAGISECISEKVCMRAAVGRDVIRNEMWVT